MNLNRLFFFSIVMFFINMITIQAQVSFSEKEQAWLNEHPIINFGYEANWPPYEIYQNGEYTGIVGDYVKLIEEYTGVDMQPIPDITWNKTISQLKSGEIHVVPIAGITDDRKEYLNFTKPYVSDPLVIVTRNNFQFVSGLADLEGKKLCLPKGYYTIDMVKNDFPKVEIITSSSVKDCLFAVSTSRADAFVGSLSVVSYYINTIGFANLKIASPTHYKYTQMGFAVTKDWVVFRDIVQKVFDNIPKEKHNEIKNKWIAVRYEHGIDTKQITNYIFYGLAVLTLIMLIFYQWNRTLRIQIEKRKSVELNLKSSLELIKQKNSEKETMLKEIHHRVKNNLQTVYSLLNMQSREVKNESTLKILADGKSRIKAMSLVHQLLYQSNDLNKIVIEDYITSLKNSIIEIYYDKEKEVSVHINTNNITLSIDRAIPLGLILNELLINSYKHAFVNRVKGDIYITIVSQESGYYFEYKDNGVGIANENMEEYKTLGMRLISRLSNQLNTQAILKNENGISVTFSFA